MADGFNFDRRSMERTVAVVRQVEAGFPDLSRRRVPRMFKKNLAACYTGDSNVEITGTSESAPTILDIGSSLITPAPIYTRSGSVVTIKRRQGTEYTLIAESSFIVTGTDVRSRVFFGIFQDPLGTPILLENKRSQADLQIYNVSTSGGSVNIGPDSDSLVSTGCYRIDSSTPVTRDKFGLGAWKSVLDGSPTVTSINISIIFQIIQLV